MVLDGKDAVFVGDRGWDNWVGLRFPFPLLPDAVLKLVVESSVLCNFSQRFLCYFKANFVHAFLILLLTSIL